jgi:hypothetical protein
MMQARLKAPAPKPAAGCYATLARRATLDRHGASDNAGREQHQCNMNFHLEKTWISENLSSHE